MKRRKKAARVFLELITNRSKLPPHSIENRSLNDLIHIHSVEHSKYIQTESFHS